MGIYIILLMILLVSGDIIKPNAKEKNKKIYMSIAFVMLGIVAAVRSSSVGSDTLQFVRAFEIIGGMNLTDAISSLRYESGFIVLCKFLNILNSNPQILIAVTSLFINGLVCLFIYRESKDVVLSVALYMVLNYYFAYINVMRQALAICIILLGYTLFLKNEKKIPFSILVLLASTFHTTAIFAIILIFVDKIEYKTKHYIITIIGAVIAFLLAPKLFAIASRLLNSYSSYANSDFYSSNYLAAIFIFLINFVILTVSFFCNKAKNKELSRMLFISSLAVIASSIGIKITLIGRMANYFNIYNIVLLPNAIKNNTKKSTKKLIYLSVLVFGIAYFIIIMKYRPEWYKVLPYVTFWNNKIN